MKVNSIPFTCYSDSTALMGRVSEDNCDDKMGVTHPDWPLVTAGRGLILDG